MERQRRYNHPQVDTSVSIDPTYRECTGDAGVQTGWMLDRRINEEDIPIQIVYSWVFILFSGGESDI